MPSSEQSSSGGPSSDDSEGSNVPKPEEGGCGELGSVLDSEKEGEGCDTETASRRSWYTTDGNKVGGSCWRLPKPVAATVQEVEAGESKYEVKIVKMYRRRKKGEKAKTRSGEKSNSSGKGERIKIGSGEKAKKQSEDPTKQEIVAKMAGEDESKCFQESGEASLPRNVILCD